MEKRLVSAVVISILVLLSFNYYTAKMSPRYGERAETLQKAGDFAPFAQDVSRETFREGQEKMPINLTQADSDKGDKFFPEVEAGEVKVETALFEALINLNGGGVESWQLKEYEDKEGKPINLVLPERQAQELPLCVFVPGQSNIIYQGGEGLKLNERNPYGEIVLQAQTGPWEITKKLVFSEKQYPLWLEIDWKNLSSEKRRLPDYQLVCMPEFGGKDKESKQYAEIKAGIFNGERIQTSRWKGASLSRRLFQKDRSGQVIKRLKEEKSGSIKWIARRTKYFAIIMKPEQDGVGIIFSGLADGGALCQIKMPGREVNPGEGFSHRFAVYFGPIDYDELKSLNLGFETIFESGLLAPLRRLVMKVLKFFYNLVGNWGIAIIFLTILAKIILLPLTQRSFRSMGEMQKLQPQISSLRQVYKDNPQTLQKETMELYRRHKVNPLGGCFPMLLQMPVFISLFTALRSAIELRNAPFVFWIKDLSSKDPFYILPLLMGGVMFAQQKMSPQADSQQARMAMLMPIFFTFIFMNFPSGLVLYWLVNSILSVGEQWWIRKEK